jgi:hypothetical protein
MKNSNKKEWQHHAFHQLHLTVGVVNSTYESGIYKTGS